MAPGKASLQTSWGKIARVGSRWGITPGTGSQSLLNRCRGTKVCRALREGALEKPGSVCGQQGPSQGHMGGPACSHTLLAGAAESVMGLGKLARASDLSACAPVFYHQSDTMPCFLGSVGAS